MNYLCWLGWDLLVIDQHNEYNLLCDITALFGTFLETYKPQNLYKLRPPVGAYSSARNYPVSSSGDELQWLILRAQHEHPSILLQNKWQLRMALYSLVLSSNLSPI